MECGWVLCVAISALGVGVHIASLGIVYAVDCMYVLRKLCVRCVNAVGVLCFVSQ